MSAGIIFRTRRSTSGAMTTSSSCPITGKKSAEIVKGAKLKSYPGYPHGMPTTEADTINADLLAFIKT